MLLQFSISQTQVTQTAGHETLDSRTLTAKHQSMIDNILMDPFDRCGFGNLNIEAQVDPPSALSPLKT